VTPVVVGIGQARAGRRAEVSAAALAARAIAMALRDAGVRLEEVGGIVRFDREAAWEYDLPGLLRVRALGYYGAVPDTPGSGAALVRLAAMAVSQELAEVVVAYHARSEPRPPVSPGILAAACNGAVDAGVPPSGRGGCAFVVRAVEHRGRVRHAPVRILGSLQAAVPSAERHPDVWLASRQAGVVRAAARRMFDEAGLGPDAVDVACLYAQPAALVPLALHDLSLPRGDGSPRVNPHAGLPAAIGLDGVDDVLEAVRQLRGEAVRQVAGARVALVASSPLEPTSAALLGVRDA
jgi:acetyl-CoA acetyltransferase